MIRTRLGSAEEDFVGDGRTVEWGVVWRRRRCDLHRVWWLWCRWEGHARRRRQVTHISVHKRVACKQRTTGGLRFNTNLSFIRVTSIQKFPKPSHMTTVNMLTLVRSSVTSRFWLRASWFLGNLPGWTSRNFGGMFLCVIKPFIMIFFRASWISSRQVKNQATRPDGQVQFKS